MPTNLDMYPFDCPECNYSTQAKTQKSLNMFTRLHKKKCKKTGRTEPSNAMIETQKKYDAFLKSVNNPKMATLGEGQIMLNKDGEIIAI